ncbi:alkaline phosphatase [Corynebacterium uterequi]|uniref:Alkaline phosphatase n=1 Tax=Corynebacterium uterequi TaxID=1072256 RepID=A0A0G3HFR3_9CORY|nr:alkaline phosphatase [Corynebacterium uterequi]AKK12119.1 Alkaline phosphatase [Corynebacterium uterequi]
MKPFGRHVAAVISAGAIVLGTTIVPAASAQDANLAELADNARTFVPTYNGPESCNPKNPDGTPRAIKPGECAQFGTEGQQRTDAKARNVILIIGDGMGQQEITAARNYLKGASGRFEGLDNFTSTGTYTHHSIDQDGTFNYVTDSAASATAWSTGAKTYNGAIGVDLEQKPVETLMEKAKRAGMRTGNVTTSELQDATPAGAATHALNRKCYGPQESENSDSCQGEAFAKQYRENGGLGSISEQLLDLRADVTLGGGMEAFNQEVQVDGTAKTPFVPSEMKWTKGQTVLENAKSNGFNVVTDAAGLDAVTEANQDKPLLGVFGDGNLETRLAPSKATMGGSHGKPGQCEPQDTKGQPELKDMTRKAIELLDKKDEEKGFFLQVESASIDKRAHAADACGMIGEVERIDEAIKEALDFAREDGNTLVVVTADHSHSTQIIYDETDTVSPTTRLQTQDGGAMTVAYGTLPADVIVNDPKASTQHTGSQLRVAAFGPGEENVIGQIDQTDVFFVLANALGLNDVPAVPASTTLSDSAKGVLLGVDRNEPVDLSKSCYKTGDPSHVPGPGDCAQFGTKGQGIDDTKAKNVVLLIGDGTGDSELTSARNYLHGANGRFAGIDALPFTGSYTHFSLNKKRGGPDYVTDSAASATAWNTGAKTYSGGVGVLLDGTPVPNLMELAKAKGMKTGNVTTSEVQDATPASFATHALNRKCYGPVESENSESCQGEAFASQYRENQGLGSISEQLVDGRADITMGGGSEAFAQQVQVDGQWAGREWNKGKSVVDNARDNHGFQVVTNLDEMEALTEANQDKPVLGLFSEGNMPRLYEQSIPTVTGPKEPAKQCKLNPEFATSQPTLAQMTAKSLDLLQNDNGFLLQVESASIDKADHDADICGQVGEAAQFDDAIQVVREWVKKTGEPTLLITTADHAHTSQITANGALTAGRATKLITADGDDMTVNYATAATNEDEDALGGQTHTGAQLRVAAEGPGAPNVVGQIDQTDIFYVAANALDLDTQADIDLTSKMGQGAPASQGTRWGIIAGGVVLIVVLAVGAWLVSRRKSA